VGAEADVAERPQQGGEKKQAMKEFAKAESMMQMAIILPASTVLGWLLGAAIDRWLKTDWVYIAGIVVGAVGGFVQIYRVAEKYMRES